MSTSPKMLANVRDLTGKHIHLGMFEEVYGLAITETTVTLGVNRAKVTHTYAGDLITKRGRTVYYWTLTPQNTWQLMSAQTVWWSTDEMHVTRERPQHDQTWEDLCYQPGTAKTPLDNSARMAQGYTTTG